MKAVLSVHKSRETTEKALKQRMKRLGKRVWERHARIVWTEQRVRPKDLVSPTDFSTWRPSNLFDSGYDLHGLP